MNLKSRKLHFVLALLVSVVRVQGQTVVNSLLELKPYIGQDNVDVQLAPGTYTINSSNVQELGNPIFLFDGNNSIYDFTDVTINYETEIFTAFGNVGVEEIKIVGNNNELRNLTMTDVGSIYDRPQRTALGIALHGQDNLIEGFNMTIKGSQPYGYGDVFGKGSGYIIKHFKHSAIQVGGDRNHIKDCNIIHRAYGHGIFMQGAVDPRIEGVYLEGEVRTTDAMLAGAYEGDGTTGEEVGWETVWGYTLPEGFMLSLQEDGIRAYTKGTTFINGDTVSDRRTTNITVLNCTVKNMRSGYSLSLGAGTKYIEGCTSIGNESGFGIGNGEVVNCFGDAAYGTVYDGEGGVEGDVTLIAPENGYYNGAKSIASISGGTFELFTATADVPSDLSIKFGSHRSFRHLPGSNLLYQVDSVFSGATVYNHSDIASDLGPGSSNCDVFTCGLVVDNGSGNTIDYWNDCDLVDYGGGCMKTLALTQAECADEISGAVVEPTDANGVSDIGSIKNGYWALYEGVDLSGMNSINITASSDGAGGFVEVRLDAVDGLLIGEVEIPNTGSWDDWQSFTANINRVSGEHNIYLVFKGTSGWLFNVDYFGFSEEVICENTNEWLEAECYDQMLGIQTENCSEGTKNVGWVHNDDWLMFSNVDLTSLNTVKARTSSNTTGSFIEVRLGSETGTLIGEINVSTTGGNQNWITDSVKITETTGVQDLYLVFKGGEGYLFNVNYFELSNEVITGSKKELTTSLSVFPNPTSGLVNFSEVVEYSVSNAYGKELLKGYSEKVDLTSLTKGVYFIKVNQDESYKIIKK